MKMRPRNVVSIALMLSVLTGCSGVATQEALQQLHALAAAPPVDPLPETPTPAGPVPPVEHPAPPPPPAVTPQPLQSGYGFAAPDLPMIDPQMPAPAEVPKVWAGLDRTVRNLAGEFPGRMSVVAVDLTSGARYEFRPNDRYYPASTFKLPVTLCTVAAIQRGELSWESLVTFTKADDDVVGQGGFAEAEYGSKWPVRNLVERSLIHSNNVAVKMLARTLTWDGLAACTEAIGGKVTRTEEGSTPVSAADEAAWWLHLWQMYQQEPKLAENLLSPLRQVPYRGRIQAGTPRPDLVTHKFGTYPPYEHDGAIVWGDRPYILVMLSYGGDHVGVDSDFETVAAAAWRSIYSD